MSGLGDPQLYIGRWSNVGVVDQQEDCRLDNSRSVQSGTISERGGPRLPVPVCRR
jgi:hypothetical protein